MNRGNRTLLTTAAIFLATAASQAGAASHLGNAGLSQASQAAPTTSTSLEVTSQNKKKKSSKKSGTKCAPEHKAAGHC